MIACEWKVKSTEVVRYFTVTTLLGSWAQADIKAIIDPSGALFKTEMNKRGIWCDADSDVNEGIRGNGPAPSQ